MTANPNQEHKPITCNFVPRWPGNPYHEELEKHLREAGVWVGRDDTPKGISESSRKTGKLPDIIHLHAVPRFGLGPLDTPRFAMFWLRLFRFQSRGVRVIWTIHDSFHHEATYPGVELMFSRLLFRRADAIIVHSAAAGRSVEKQWGVSMDKRVFVVPHGNYIQSYPNTVNKEQARAKLGVPEGKTTFLFLGLIRPYKGVVGLIEAFKSLANDNTHLLIAGKPLTAKLSTEISAAAGGHAGIHYRPERIGNEEIQDYLNAADVMVFPYTRALTSGALILGMSFGRACIAPKMGALEDTLDESGGFLYDPTDPNGLRNAMQNSVAASPKLADMGSSNMKLAMEWDWSRIARLTADVYKNGAGTDISK